MKTFVGAAVKPVAGSFDPAVPARGEPGLPRAFAWGSERLAVGAMVRTWRTYKDDRGDTYVDRLWFEFTTPDGRCAVVYFDKHARRAAERWRLYTLEDAP